MPTVRIEYQPQPEKWPEPIYRAFLKKLADKLPTIIAPEMNINGRDLHDGGVSENEILVDGVEYSHLSRNVNNVQITVIAHRFDERVARLDEVTTAIKNGVLEVLRDFDRDLTIGISVCLVEMGYASIQTQTPTP